MFLVNDLSINGQFASSEAFLSALRRLLDARDQSALLRNSILCSRLLKGRPATATQTFQAAVQTHGNNDLKRRILRWVGQAGPFWEDEPANVADNLFYFADEDVTLQGLGEAARRCLNGTNAATYSLPNSGNGCDNTSLIVAQGLPEAKIAEIEVPNHLSIESMKSAAEGALAKPKNWVELLARAALLYDAVLLSPEIERVLRPYPYSSNVSERTLELLGVLDRLVKSRDENRQFTDVSNCIIANYFSGKTARFTDESSTNKSKYREAMTFADPDEPGKKLFCPFHGKINNPAYRIHIRWPLQVHHEKILVSYIGPKITI
ncbi:hypothetical protein [Pinisolibacter aquiterrae]|uniref:hypothetical protein n=1 Tax=Pinisolibacter aquiterrae TaxID=2815579 RepID=UPI001C3C4AF1|nr:hypothetical protein [Pinisolibacter aquiterrae]MBV5262898.1 hypothetical protein [Pinisolibacter aquiterrae]MCC8235745.1 hypothetical protein [Pinisolibacter aquiterrae]